MLSVTVDDLKKIGQIKENLLVCSSKDAIDSVFNQYGIVDYSVRTILLRQSMQVQGVFDVPICNQTSDEDDYNEERDIFLDGKWKELI